MKFKLISAKYFVDGYKHIRELVEDGFVIEGEERPCITSTPEIEISTLEDLVALSKRYEEALVINPAPPYSKDGLPEITIYNGYLE